MSTDPIVYYTMLHHAQLEKELKKEDLAEAKAFRMVKAGEFSHQDISCALDNILPSQKKSLFNALALEDDMESGRILRNLLIDYLIDECLENDF